MKILLCCFVFLFVSTSSVFADKEKLECSEQAKELPVVDIDDVFKKIKAKYNLDPEFCNAYNYCYEWSDDMSEEEEKKLLEAPKKGCSEMYQRMAEDPGDVKENINFCNLSKNEFWSILAYTEFTYTCINGHLRTGKTNPHVNFLTKMINSGLSKLPTYEGFVVRGTSLPNEVRENHKKGNVVTYKAYTSTSARQGFESDDMFIIFSKTGKALLSINPSESEILFRHGTQFKILDTSKKNGKNYYVMKEIGAKDNTKIEEKLEQEILTKVQENKDKLQSEFDTWDCSQKGASPKKLQQKFLPNMTY